MAPAKKPAGGGRKKAANGYQMPEPVPPGTVLTDMAKRQWKVGPSIGSGGFGEIYSACEAGSGAKKSEDYPYVVKIVSLFLVERFEVIQPSTKLQLFATRGLV